MTQVRMYCGLLDDFAVRHNDGNPIKTLAELNGQLISTVLFGDPLIVNDGHVLLNEAVQDAVTYPKKSPFRNLVECGYVSILSRNQGALGSLAEFMANQGITSADRLLAQTAYTEKRRPALESWAASLTSGAFDAFRRWPDYRTDQVYGAVAATALTSLIDTEPSRNKELSRFKQALGAQVTRTAWEDTAEELRRANELSPDVHLKLMHAANEAYQYSWGCMLSDSNNPVRVQTRLSRYLGILDKPIGEPTRAKRSPVSVYVPDITFAGRAVGARWDLLAQIGTLGTQMNQLKQQYLTMLTKYQTSDDIADSEMKDMAKKYSKALSKHFGHPKRVAGGVDFVFSAVSAGAPLVLAGPVGIAVGLTVAAGGFVAARLNVSHNLLWVLGAPRPKSWIGDAKSATPERAVSWFELDPQKVASFLAGTSPFNSPRG